MTEVTDLRTLFSQEYTMNFRCWPSENILRMFWMFLECDGKYVKILDGYLEVL